MKVNVEIDCTPSEARAFLGLPDVAPLNEAMVAEMQKRMAENVAAMQPEELMKTWTSFGLQAQEQFRKLRRAGVTFWPKLALTEAAQRRGRYLNANSLMLFDYAATSALTRAKGVSEALRNRRFAELRRTAARDKARRPQA